ncbi:hypothetical protein [Eoetvoesiella caeni]|uniref:hypothetical protein n=1 Tax=Eoetvoesiella caeni TaxID=645616 RepID=UPI0011BF48D6|nr:hypothetical protein [Eoetvoesiella caeni]MCI2807795.1 hypothetical protein [Eoetvoesiella caeni]NYT54202.1 hypothetical protein [Eoetvoesiella caeni]
MLTNYVILKDRKLIQIHYSGINYELLVRRVIFSGFALSSLGFVFLLFDKLYVQGIDYSQGFAVAREQWRLHGEERGGQVSSIYSVVGYLIGSSYFISLALLVSKNLKMRDCRRVFWIIFGLLLLLANSAITGGRSSILLLLAFLVYAYRTSSGSGARELVNSKIAKIVFALCGLGMVVYVLYIFSLRSDATGVSFAAYGAGFLDFMGLAPARWFVSDISNSPLGGIFALVNLAVSYLTHSFATTAAIFDESFGHGNVIFNTIYQMLAKLGLIDAPDPNWFLSGRFPSLPGALYFQFGWLGLVVSAFLIGIWSSMVNLLYKFKWPSISMLLLCCCSESILLISPFLFAGDFISFPFIITGSFIAIFLVRLWTTCISGIKPMGSGR